MNSISNGEIAAEIVKGIGIEAIVEFIKKILSWFKKKTKRVFFPSDQEKTKKVIEEVTSSEFKKNPITVEFKGNYNIVNIGGNYGFVPKKDSENDIIKILKNSREGESKQKVNILPIERAEDFIDYQNTPKYIEKYYGEVLGLLDPKFKSLVALSIFIDECYNNDLKEKIEDIKKDIRDRYGDPGLKFINLWSRGYLKNLLIFLSQKFSQGTILPLDINNKFLEFIEKSDTIFFIHLSTEINKTASEINEMLKMGKDYVAIHSLGLNTLKAREIIKRVNLPENFNYTVVSIDKQKVIKEKEKVNDVSRIWYKDSGLSTYLLIKDIIL